MKTAPGRSRGKNVVRVPQIGMIHTRALRTQKGKQHINMKYLTILALAVAAIGFGACAKDHSAEVSTSTHATSTGYSK